MSTLELRIARSLLRRSPSRHRYGDAPAPGLRLAPAGRLRAASGRGRAARRLLAAAVHEAHHAPAVPRPRLARLRGAERRVPPPGRRRRRLADDVRRRRGRRSTCSRRSTTCRSTSRGSRWRVTRIDQPPGERRNPGGGAAHCRPSDSRTTKLYDRRGQKVLLEDMERIRY